MTTDGDAEVGPDVVVNLPNANGSSWMRNAGTQMLSQPNGGQLPLSAQAEHQRP